MPDPTLETFARRVEHLERAVGRLLPAGVEPPGTTGDPQSDDPAEVARWVAAFDSIPPAEMSPAEEAAWQAERTTRKQSDVAAVDRLIQALPGSAG